MGMFDCVHFEMDCPECGGKVTGFQTKDGDCICSTVEPDAIANFYTSCKKCGAWIEFSRKRNPAAPLREKSLTVEEVKAMGYEVTVTAPNYK